MYYDFYGGLLKQHQQEIYEAYVNDNLSLSEIGEQEGTTRQGVHDLISRCEAKMRDYEEKLHLIENYRKNRNCIRELRSLLETSGELRDRERIEALLQELEERL